jgi:hypothetical protein
MKFGYSPQPDWTIDESIVEDISFPVTLVIPFPVTLLK